MRNVRRLQLVFFLLFYEDQNLDMPCHASEPMSKPVQPQALYFRPVLSIAQAILSTRPNLTMVLATVKRLLRVGMINTALS